MADLTVLNRKRGSVKAKLTNFSKYLDSLESKTISDTEIIQLKERLHAASEIKDEFDVVQGEIELSVTETEVEKQFQYRADFDDEYFSQISLAKKIIRDNTDADDHSVSGNTEAGTNNVEVNNGSNLKHIKLPTINLPKFDGAYQNWLEFRDTFSSLIHENVSISSVQKFHYLRASLGSDAALVIKSLEISSANYDVAWKALLERYDNNKLLIYNHVKALFVGEAATKESAVGIRKLIDDFSKNMRALEQLKQPVHEWDTLLIYMISTKLDSVTLREWENSKADLENPKFSDIKSFLKGRADMLEMVAQNQNEKRKNVNSSTRGFLSTDTATKSPQCVSCQGSHYVHNCHNFLKLSPTERESKARSLKICTNCLRRGHYSRICRRGTCTKCPEKHHTLLHRDKQEQTQTSVSDSSSEKVADQNGGTQKNTELAMSACESVDHVFLSTAYVQVLDRDANTHTVRVLLDSGAQSSFVRRDLCDRLNLKTHSMNCTVKGINSVSSNINLKCEMTVQSLYNSYSRTKWFYVIDSISENIPAATVNISKLSIPEHINLADPTFYKPQSVDVLIGADLFWELLCVGQVALGPHNPVLQKTRFGWIVSGPISQKANSINCNFAQSVSEDLDLQKCLRQFWEIEEVVTGPSRSNDEIACEEHFNKHTKRSEEGRFIVTLPLKNSPENLGNSFDVAKKRFLSLENKFRHNPELKNMYGDFIEEYERLGHMNRVTENAEEGGTCYYMPHHGVLKADSLTTKLRVVFDASCPSTSGLSLNDLQYVGPTIQESLFSILLRFRQHTFVICADISKMYRQVLVTPEQRCLQRILWRKKVDDAITIYQLNTVTYGTAAAAFLAIRCLVQVARENEDKHPKLAKIIERDFYVDDLLSGADELEEAAQICAGISTILKQGGFELRKFYSNERNVLKYVDDKGSDHNIINFGEHENAKTLGIAWSPVNDNLSYKIADYEEEQISKRSILSNISQVFDPLGLLAPCVILAKITLQKLWLEKLTWDESVPTQIHTFWREFRRDLPALNDLRIPRRVIGRNADTIEIHGFSDASESAYGSCIYIRTSRKDGTIFTQLLCAKSKVSPLKTITLPRLELAAALVLTRLLKQVRDSMDMKFERCILWTDSTIVLGWLKQPPNKLKTFVSNRVAEIQNLTASDVWRHVPSKQNPADLVSRGLKPKLLINNELWWNGPQFLNEDESKWPEMNIADEKLPDTRKPKTQMFIAALQTDFMKKYSDLGKLKRVTAYVIRFLDNCKRKARNEQIKTGILDSSEISKAMTCLLKRAQHENYQSEMIKIKNGKALGDSKISNLNPFLDSNGVLRVGGRLNNAKFRFEKRHPAILAAQSQLAQMLARYTHLRLLHARPQQVLAAIREEYWIVGGRILIKGIVRKCIPCYRFRPTLHKPIMAPLPEMRLSSRQLFDYVGVDYAGPVMIKSKSGRGFKIAKAYICLFICCVTKAVHIELVTSLSKEDFLLCLKRFVARRGQPSCIYSDNGTNFVAASHELRELGRFMINNNENIAEYFQKNEINWKFIPPHSPHFGGLWEAGIKSLKHHLRRVVRDLILTFEQLYTVLVEAEAILNSRPLSPLSDSPHDLTPLTPSHFLVGRPLTALPEPDLNQIPTNRLSIYQHLTQIKQHLWKRWSKEYVSELQLRTKWKQHGDSLKLGTLVLIKEDNQPPLKWRLGRVEDVHPGSDGVARVATLRTETGLVKRSFAKICPLPLDDAPVMDGERQ